MTTPGLLVRLKKIRRMLYSLDMLSAIDGKHEYCALLAAMDALIDKLEEDK
ncbi:MAG: hypothetical protein ACYDBI_05930 [Thermoplasmataceae archaeon]